MLKRTLPRVRLQRKNIFQKNRLSLQYFRKCSESADVSIPKVVLALSSLGPQWSKKNPFEKKIILKPGQNKKGQKIFRLHHFLNTFYNWQLRKSIQKRCSWKFFWSFLFCDGFRRKLAQQHLISKDKWPVLHKKIWFKTNK